MKSEPRQKQNRRPEPRKHTNDPHFGYISVFNSDFLGTMRLIFESFLIAPTGPIFKFLRFCNKMDVKKPTGSPLYIFWQCDTAHKHPEHILLKILRFLSLRYSADFGSSRLVQVCIHSILMWMVVVA